MKFHIFILLLVIQSSLAALLEAEEILHKQIPKISVAHKKLPCELEWKKSSHITPTGVNYVTISSRRIGRAKILGQYAFGLVSSNSKDDSSGFPSGSFYSTRESRFLQLTNFDFLTNPNNCQIIWEPMGSEDGMKWMCTTPHCIGRRIIPNTYSIEICTPSSDSKKCLPTPDQNSPSISNFEILRSIRKTLDYRVSDVHLLDNELMVATTLKGTDRIMNAANVEVVTSMNKDSGKAKEDGTEERQLTITGTGGSNQKTTANYSSQSFSESISAARGLRIPPYTFIEACSTTDIPDLPPPIKLIVSFYAADLKAEEVEEILKASQQLEGPFLHSSENTVQVELEGTMERGMLADLLVKTNFEVYPLNSKLDYTCSAISRNLGETRQKQVLKLLHKMKQRNFGHLKEDVHMQL